MRRRGPGRRPAAAGALVLNEPAAPEVAALLQQARAGQARALARLVSLLERPDGPHREIAVALAPYGERARVIGVTGAPGVGKSTTTSALVRHLRRRGERVGVIAVDPSSPFTGGALLGDRIRMQEHATDPAVYVRSMAARGHLGGLAVATPAVLRLLDAAGFDTVLIETVGVGQSEVEVAGTADTVLVLLAPGSGDAVQVAKAGLLEVGDVYAVNKADRDGAEAVVKELRQVLGVVPRAAADWARPVVRTVATTDEGIPDLLAALDAHAAWAGRSGELARRREARAAREIAALALAHLTRSAVPELDGQQPLTELARRVVAGELDPWTAADLLLAARAD